MTEFSPLAAGLIVATFVALLGGLGWLITSQIATNKSLSRGITDLSKGVSDIVTEFKAAMAKLEERSENQKTLCQSYRAGIYGKQKDLEREIEKIQNKLE